MYIFKYIDAGATTVFMVVFFILVVIFQFLLCYKVKNLFFRLMPITVFVVSTVVFSVLSAFNNSGLYGMDLLFFAFFSFTTMLACAFGWAIWKIIGKRNR